MEHDKAEQLSFYEIEAIIEDMTFTRPFGKNTDKTQRALLQCYDKIMEFLEQLEPWAYPDITEQE